MSIFGPDGVIPAMAVWLMYVLFGVVCGLLVGYILRGDTVFTALYTALAILFAAAALVFSAGYVMDHPREPSDAR